VSGVSYDPAAHVYDATRGYLPGVADKIRDVIVQATGSSAHTRYLELGVGTGRIALPFILAGNAYTGIDLSHAMLRRLMLKTSLHSASTNPRSRPVRGDVCRLPFMCDTFDVVVAVNVFHLVDDAMAALHEARRVMTGSNGQLVIARDGRYEQPDAAVFAPSRLVQQHWRQVLASLGVPRRARSVSPWMRLDSEATGLLERSGATWKRLPTFEYESTGRSARDAFEDLKTRAYSDEWSLPDDIHAQAIQRLARWVNESCPRPDDTAPRVGRFDMIVARWAEGR